MLLIWKLLDSSMEHQVGRSYHHKKRVLRFVRATRVRSDCRFALDSRSSY